MMQKTNAHGKEASADSRQMAIMRKMPFTGRDSNHSYAFVRVLDILAGGNSDYRSAMVNEFIFKYGGMERVSSTLQLHDVFKIWAAAATRLGYSEAGREFALLAIEADVLHFGPELAAAGKLAAKYGLSEDEVKAAKEKGARALYMRNFESEMGFADRYLPSALHYEKPLKLAESRLSSKEVQRAAFGMLTSHIFGGEFQDARAVALEYSFSEENVKAAAIIALRRFMGAHPEKTDRQEKIASIYGLSEKEVLDCAAKACRTLIQNYISKSDETEEFIERHRLYGNRELMGKLHWARIDYCESLMRRGRHDEAEKIAEEYNLPRYLAIIMDLKNG